MSFETRRTEAWPSRPEPHRTHCAALTMQRTRQPPRVHCWNHRWSQRAGVCTTALVGPIEVSLRLMYEAANERQAKARFSGLVDQAEEAALCSEEQKESSVRDAIRSYIWYMGWRFGDSSTQPDPTTTCSRGASSRWLKRTRCTAWQTSSQSCCTLAAKTGVPPQD